MNNPSSVSQVKQLLIEHGLTVWRYKWLALGVAWLVCLAGWGGIMTMPRYYAASARAYVDVNGLLAPLLKGLVVDTTAQSQEIVRQTLLSRANLEQVVSLAQLDTNSQAQKDALILKLSQDITIRPQGNNLFTISYTSTSPTDAKNVVDAMLTLYAEKAAGSSRTEMEKARSFLDTQIEGYAAQLRAAEQRRADFRQTYGAYFSDPASGTPKLASVQTAMDQARLAYNQALATRDSLTAQLQRVPPFQNVALPGGAVAPVVQGDSAPLVTQRLLAQALDDLTAMRLKYTDQHPAVLAAQRNIADLQRQVSEATAAVAQSQPPATGQESIQAVNPRMTQVPNPTYEQIRLRLVDVETTIPSIKQRLDNATSEFEKVKALTAQLPDIDAKAKDLDRDYEVIKQSHETLIARRESANLSQAADDQADRTQFRIIDPPQIPLAPSFPNFPIMFTVVLLAGIGTGLATPIALATLRATFSSTVRLRELGLPVIGTVTYVWRPGSKRLASISAAGLAMASAALLVVYGVVVVYASGTSGGIL